MQLDALETECVLYYHQSFDTTARMTATRLQQLYNTALRREKNTPEPLNETEDERNRRVILAALTQQRAEDAKNKSPKTRYTG